MTVYQFAAAAVCRVVAENIIYPQKDIAGENAIATAVYAAENL